MGGTEVQHFLGFGDAANQRTGQHPTLHHQVGGMHGRVDRLDQAHQDVHAVELQGLQIRIEVVLHGNGVEQEVETARRRAHLLGIGRHDHMVGTLAAGFLGLGPGAGEQGHFGAQGLGQLDAHMAQPAHAEDADLVAGADAMVLERRVGGDACAKDRRRAGQVHASRDAHHEVLADHDAAGITTHGVAAIDPVRGGVGHGRAFEAVLLQALGAGLAVAAGVDHATDTDQVADLVRGDLVTHRGDPANDLVAGHQRVHGDAPFVARLVDVGMANATVEDLDGDVVRARGAALEGHGGQGAGRGLGGVTDGGVHAGPHREVKRFRLRILLALARPAHG